jgi:H/ACA ribonucleoprotein complex subunit 2
MAKDIKEKKEKKEKRSEVDGVKKSKKDKKEKKSVAVDAEMVDALEAELEKAPEVSLVKVVDGEEVEGALVPFAFPLADDSKEVKKILKTVKKCTSPKTLLCAYVQAHEMHVKLEEHLADAACSRQIQNPPPRR